MTPLALLHAWLDARLEAAGAAWLHEQADALAAAPTDRVLYRAVSLVARRLGTAPLALNAAEIAAAAQARPLWDPSHWTVDQAARIALLLAAGGDGETFSRRLDALCATADLEELVAFYRGLPLFPDAPRHAARAAEGVRSNMRSVFEAVAHRNPYPAEQLAEDAWNQMVLKALFVGSRLDPIVGLDARANAHLARMLGDYAHERWAAGRPISPELWRCVGPFATGALLDDLARVLESGSAGERAAAMLALQASPDPGAPALLARHAALRGTVRSAGLDWSGVTDFH